MTKPCLSILAALCALPLAAQQPKPAMELKYAVIVSRHGVRAPTWTPQRLNEYSSAPWPDWGVAPGFLTVHGRALMKTMGSFYREYFSAAGLLGKAACDDAKRTYFRADLDQRTIETGRALADGLLPRCSVVVHSALEGQKAEPAADPLFDPAGAGAVNADSALALAAVSARLGPDLGAVVAANRSAFTALDTVLRGAGKAAKSIFDDPVSVTSGKKGATMAGPLSIASTLSENLLLEYTNGMSGSQLGWGRLDAAGLLQIMRLHSVYADLMRRTPYLAKVRGSNLLRHIERSLEQAMQAKPVPGSLGPAGTQLAVLSGHDTNLSNLSGILGLSWQLPTYQPDDAPPGSALIFSLWRAPASGQYFVRLQFIAQTMDQMHDGTPLSLKTPPVVTDVFVPGCSKAAQGFACDWKDFRSLVLANIL